MKFFIPCATDQAMAEQVWAGVRQWLADQGLATTRRRIRALALEIDGVDHYVAVGGGQPDDESEPVVVILEAADIDLYYVCTPGRGVLRGPPIPVALGEDWRVIDFDEEVVGWA